HAAGRHVVTASAKAITRPGRRSPPGAPGPPPHRKRRLSPARPWLSLRAVPRKRIGVAYPRAPRSSTELEVTVPPAAEVRAVSGEPGGDQDRRDVLAVEVANPGAAIVSLFAVEEA